MNPTPAIDMFSGTGQLAHAVGATLTDPTQAVSISAQRRLAGNAVVGLQARLMLQRGLIADNHLLLKKRI